jgi:protein-S-isoprenylcysteine O-methyltransferase Ste14
MTIRLVDLALTLIVPLAVAAVLFLSAGRVDIPAFWAYVAFLAAVSVAGLLIIDPELMDERRRPGGRPMPARYLWAAAAAAAHWAVAGLDRGRFFWSAIPGSVEAAALIAAAAAGAFGLWATRVNRFFSSVVRIQSDRGHTLVTGGPYRWVRHPGYLFAVGSWPATLIGLMGEPFLLWRTASEDRFLQANLPGYRAYAQRVRYRLVPGVW